MYELIWRDIRTQLIILSLFRDYLKCKLNIKQSEVWKFLLRPFLYFVLVNHWSSINQSEIGLWNFNRNTSDSLTSTWQLYGALLLSSRSSNVNSNLCGWTFKMIQTAPCFKKVDKKINPLYHNFQKIICTINIHCIIIMYICLWSIRKRMKNVKHMLWDHALEIKIWLKIWRVKEDRDRW